MVSRPSGLSATMMLSSSNTIFNPTIAFTRSSSLRDQVNGRGFEDRKYFGTLHKPKVGNSLAGNEGNKFETDIYNHFGQNAGRHDIGYASLQVIACAALLSASLLEGHVFTADAD